MDTRKTLTKFLYWYNWNNPTDKTDIDRIINNYFEYCESFPVELPVMRFAKPTIDNVDYNKWVADNIFNAEIEDTTLDSRILENYIEVVEQFIGSPESQATKAVFEIATQTIKKYLVEQNA